jgi:hypothetical protein
MTDDLTTFIQRSEAIPGWTRGEDAEEVVRVSLSLGPDAIIVEIGAFLGSSTVLLAGPRLLRGSGKVHAVDVFDCSGDAFSVPHYQEILRSIGGGSPRNHFEPNIREAGLSEWVEVHQGRASEIAGRCATTFARKGLADAASSRSSTAQFTSPKI